MTDTTSAAAAALPQAVNQAATSGAPITGNGLAGVGNGIQGSVANATPDLANLASPAADAAASAAAIAPAAGGLSSGLIVDGTLWILIGFSVITWTLILIKGIQHLRISHHNRAYGKQFWGAKDLQSAAFLDNVNGPAARVAEVGFTTLIEADGGTTTHDLEHTGDRQELLDRRLRQQMQKERGSLESGLAILATVGSISPFVGLFGTVWGIMGALTSISKSGSASLEVVAGPIGEALIATAVGIAVAVPAVIAYNFFIRRNKVIWAFLDDFAIDFVHLALKTSFLIKRPGKSAGLVKANDALIRKNVLKSNQDDIQAEGAQI